MGLSLSTFAAEDRSTDLGISALVATTLLNENENSWEHCDDQTIVGDDEDGGEVPERADWSDL